MLDALIDWLRSASRNMTQPMVPLGDELQSVRGYLSVMQQRMGELLPHALGMIQWVNEQFEEPRPFENDPQEFIEYAADRAQRRLGAIESARGVPVAQIDLDYSPEQLEETFGEEDAKAFAEAVG